MEIIKIKEGTKAGKFIEELLQHQKEFKEKVKREVPSKEIHEHINKKTEDTYNCNGGNLDKESFKLGMYSMWYYLNKKL